MKNGGASSLWNREADPHMGGFKAWQESAAPIPPVQGVTRQKASPVQGEVARLCRDGGIVLQLPI